MPPTSGPNACRPADFTQDALKSRRDFRTPNLVDVVTWMCLAIEVDTSVPAARTLDRLAAAHGSPRAFALNAGTVLTTRVPGAWAHAHGVDLRFSRPGTSSGGPSIESFDARLRDECQHQRWFDGLADARLTIKARRIHHSLNRPYGSLGNLILGTFAARASACFRSAPPPSGPLKFEEPATL